MHFIIILPFASKIKGPDLQFTGTICSSAQAAEWDSYHVNSHILFQHNMEEWVCVT